MGYPRIRTDRLDPEIQAWLLAAQVQADNRGASHLVSGLVLIAAAQGDSDFSKAIRNTLESRAPSTSVEVLLELEWSERTVRHLDQPATLVREAIEMSAAEVDQESSVRPLRFVATLVSFDDGMATRMVRRAGMQPAEFLESLRSGDGS